MERIHDWKVTRSGAGLVVNGYTHSPSPDHPGTFTSRARKLTNVVEVSVRGNLIAATDGNGTQYKLVVR